MRLGGVWHIRQAAAREGSVRPQILMATYTRARNVEEHLDVIREFEIKHPKRSGHMRATPTVCSGVFLQAPVCQKAQTWVGWSAAKELARHNW